MLAQPTTADPPSLKLRRASPLVLINEPTNTDSYPFAAEKLRIALLGMKRSLFSKTNDSDSLPP